MASLRSWPRRRWVAAAAALPLLLVTFLRVAAPAPGATSLWVTLVGLAAAAGSLTLASYLPVRGWRPDLGCSPCAAVSGLTLVGALVVLDGYGPDLSGALLALMLTTFGLVQRLRQEPTCVRA
jgi:hypothetical protein